MNDFVNGMKIPKRNTMKLNQPSLVFGRAWASLNQKQVPFSSWAHAIPWHDWPCCGIRIPWRRPLWMQGWHLWQHLWHMSLVEGHTPTEPYQQRWELGRGERSWELWRFLGVFLTRKWRFFGAIVGIPYGTIHALLVKLCWRMSVPSF